MCCLSYTPPSVEDEGEWAMKRAQTFIRSVLLNKSVLLCVGSGLVWGGDMCVYICDRNKSASGFLINHTAVFGETHIPVHGLRLFF